MIAPSLAEPSVQNDDDIARLGERSPQLVVNVPILPGDYEKQRHDGVRHPI